MVVIDVYRDEAKFKSEALKVVENIRKLKGNINIDLIKSGRPAPAALASYIFIDTWKTLDDSQASDA